MPGMPQDLHLMNDMDMMHMGKIFEQIQRSIGNGEKQKK